MLLRGFDVLIEPSEGTDSYHATVSEGGSVGWEVDVPVDLSEIAQAGIEDSEDLDGSDALMQYVGNAAVDLFEAQRDTLGEGATAPEVQAMKTVKKQSYTDSIQWEDWYMRLKGTPFEDQATDMLTEYFQLSFQCSEAGDMHHDLWQEERKVLHDLNMLNLERMKALPAGQTVIIIQGSRPKEAFWGACQLDDYLARFIGDVMEPQAISKVRELLDIRDRQNMTDQDDTWKQQQSLENQMFDLELQALQQNVRVPSTGAEAAPNMAGDVAELMQGVDLHAPLEPMGEGGMNEFAQQARRRAFEEVEPVEDRIEELGEMREGLDPAEMEGEQFSFNTNDYVELKEEITVSGPGWGGKTTYPKGTKGYAENQFDKSGDHYLIRTVDGRALIKVRWDQIKTVSRR